MEVRSVLPRDAIPSIDDPVFETTYVGDETDEVIIIEASPPRAYPIRILNFHEIVNDEIDGDPIAVTWCPLCGSAVVYSREIDGRTLTFGVSGKLADDDLVMYDRETDSEWKQSQGICIAGELEGSELAIEPASVSTWMRFQDRYPDGLVLQPEETKSEAASGSDEPAEIEYSMEPYDAYFEMDGFGLGAHRGESETRTWDREDIAPKTIVLGVERGDQAIGFPQPVVERAGCCVTETVGGETIVVVAIDGQLHAFEHPGFSLHVEAGEINGDGTTWDPVSGRSPDGRSLTRIGAKRLFAFTWQDDHGPDAFYGLST